MACVLPFKGAFVCLFVWGAVFVWGGLVVHGVHGFRSCGLGFTVRGSGAWGWGLEFREGILTMIPEPLRRDVSCPPPPQGCESQRVRVTRLLC